MTRECDRPTVVVFDAMGVLYAAGDDVSELVIPYLRELGSGLAAAEIHALYRRASLGEMTSAEFWAACGVRGDDAVLCGRHALVPGIADLLADLRGAGVPLACLSNDLSEWSVRLRRRFGLEDLIGTWVISGDIGLRKPAREAFQALARATGVPPERMVFFDDRPDNVTAASAYGIDALQFTDVRAARAALQARGLLDGK